MEADMDKAPNEKLIDTLFIYYALRHLEASGGSVYTPSSRQEYEDGYDAKLMGVRGFDELYLQFKTPHLLQWNGYSFGTYKHQHDRLRAYPINTAYYLTHIFRNVEQVLQAQRGAKVPLDFLEWYIAINIGVLGDVKRFRYYGKTVFCRELELSCRLTTDFGVRPKWPLDKSAWMTGAELLMRFELNEVGTRMILESGEDPEKLDGARLTDQVKRDRMYQMSRERARQMVSEDEKTDLGFALRKNAEPLLQANQSNR
jgi:hypothetical protein